MGRHHSRLNLLRARRSLLHPDQTNQDLVARRVSRLNVLRARRSTLMIRSDLQKMESKLLIANVIDPRHRKSSILHLSSTQSHLNMAKNIRDQLENEKKNPQRFNNMANMKLKLSMAVFKIMSGHLVHHAGFFTALCIFRYTSIFEGYYCVLANDREKFIIEGLFYSHGVCTVLSFVFEIA